MSNNAASAPRGFVASIWAIDEVLVRAVVDQPPQLLRLRYTTVFTFDASIPLGAFPSHAGSKSGSHERSSSCAA